MKKLIRVAVTGPESTAKSSLSIALANYFNGTFYPEYAREYFKDHSSEYTYSDVEIIAKKQIEQYHDSGKSSNEFVFFDTWLIITKVWFQWAFNREPSWLDTAIAELPMDLYLLCAPDIPWEPDLLRENGGEQRQRLFEAYKKELIFRNLNFMEVSGEGEIRVQNAIQAVKSGLGL